MPQEKISFVVLALRDFKDNARREYLRVNGRRLKATGWMQRLLDGSYAMGRSRPARVIGALAATVWLGIMGWFVSSVLSGEVRGDAWQAGAGGAVLMLPLGLLAGLLLGLAAYVFLLVTNRLFAVVAPLALFPPLILWTPIYLAWEGGKVAAKLLLLLPLLPLVLATRLVQLWRRIMHVCPNRSCTYRGLPAFVCPDPDCGEANPDLWPNLYGLLTHDCLGCGRSLWTLNILGRGRYARVCRRCGRPFLGRSAGKLPERLISLIGGPSSGKSCYLVMAVGQIIRGQRAGAGGLHGKIDDVRLLEDFLLEWSKMAVGQVPDLTAEVAQAFLLSIERGCQKCQLYLYDALGEEFVSRGGMKAQQYLPLIEGAIVMVDPLGFAEIRSGMADLKYEPVPFKQVVDSALGAALSGIAPGSDGKLPVKIAVVIAKSDIPKVRARLGDVAPGAVPGSACREALARWEGEATLRLLEQKFRAVEYFACSALGRPADSPARGPFEGEGVLEPLAWLLTGKRARLDAPEKIG